MRRCYLLLFISFLSATLYCQPFSCNGDLLISLDQTATSYQTQKVSFGPFGSIFFYPIKSFSGGHFEAIGFNPMDNYLYGAKQNSNEIVRLKADESFETIGQVPFVTELNVSAGDCSPQGQYICIENDLDQILVFDVINNFELVRQIDLFWDPESSFSGPFTARLGDLTIDPTNPTIGFGFQGNFVGPDLSPAASRGFLHRINLNLNDPDVGMVTPIGQISTPEVRKIGSLFFNEFGGLFGYGSIAEGNDLKQNTLVQIDKFTGESFVFPWTGPTGNLSDGCSCPYTFTFQCDVNPKDVLCTDSKLTYNFSINNRFFQDVPSATFFDSLPSGMIIESIEGNFTGDITAGTGVGTGFLEINNLFIPGGGFVNISIEVQVNDIPIDFVDNQAFLSNLPDRFGNTLASDDPGSMGEIGDATTVVGNAQSLTEFAIDITPPSDCINANDAILKLSSPVFISGQSYEVKMRNEDWEVSSWQVNIDDNNSFVLENMLAGDYSLFQMTPQSSNCSFEIRDTTINIIPPNEQLSAEVITNSPICENAILTLNAELAPLGTVKWIGPGINSTELENTIPSANPNFTGTYEMVASYGACEQVRTFDVEVAPAIEANIDGKNEYCERETVQLLGEGEGEVKKFSWSSPQGKISEEPAFVIESMATEHQGEYRLVIDLPQW